MSELNVKVYGTPRPQGSIQVKAYKKDGKAILGSTTKGLEEWRAEVARELGCGAEQQNFAVPLAGPVRVELHFRLARPGSVKRLFPYVRPDLDKLVRATMDALTDSRVIGDDAQVCEIHASKQYCNVMVPDEGVFISLKEVEDA